MRRLRRIGKRLLLGTALFFAVYTGVFLFWNDERLARSIDAWASETLRGSGGPTHQAFVIGKAHYPYWCSLRSLVVGGSCFCDAWESHIYDEHGNEVLWVPHARTRVYIGQLVWAKAFSLFSGQVLDLHFADATVNGGKVNIALNEKGEVNLVAAMSGKNPGPPPPGGMRVTLEGADFRNVDYSMDFGGWKVHAPSASGHGKLRMSSFAADSPDPRRPAFTFAVEPIDAPEAELVLGTAPPYAFHLSNLHARRFGAPDDATDTMFFQATADARGGAAGGTGTPASAVVDGKLTNLYVAEGTGADLTIDFQHGSSLVGLLDLGDLVGGDPQGDIHIHGPFTHVLIDGSVEGATVGLMGLHGEHAGARLHLDGDTLALDGAHADLGGGRVTGKLAIHFAALTWQGDFKSEGIDPGRLEPLVPRSAHGALAGRLDGGVHLEASLDPRKHPERIRVRRISARLERRGTGTGDPLPSTVHVAGGLRVSPTDIELDDVSVSGDGVTVGGKGRIDPRHATADAEITIEAAHLAPLLRRLGSGSYVDGLHARAHVTGSLTEPLVEGSLHASGVGPGDRKLPSVDADIRLAHGRLYARSISGDGFGGHVGGDVELQLWNGGFAHPLADPALHAELEAVGMRLHTLAGAPFATAVIAGHLSLAGTLADPTGHAELRIPQLKLYDDPYHGGELTLALGDHRAKIDHLVIERDGGGRLFGSGYVGYGGELGVDLAARDFPIGAIPQLRNLPIAVGGTIDGKLHLGGDFQHPEPSGSLAALAFKFREILLGDGHLDIIPGGDAIRLSGDFFDRFHIDGYLTLVPALAVHVKATFHDQPLEDLIPELKRLAEIHSLVTGEAIFSYDAASGMPYAELRLSQLKVTLAAQDLGDEDDPEHTTDEFENDGEVILSTDGRKLTFRQARLRSNMGKLEIAGDVSAEASDLSVIGQLKLELLEYFTQTLFQHTHGSAVADLHITGAAARPRVTGSLDLSDAKLVPRGADRPFTVTGHVAFQPDGVRLDNLDMDLDGMRAHASGHLAVADWIPGAIELDVKGDVAPILLEWIYPEYVTEPTGRFHIDASVRGKLLKPTWSGRIDIDDVAFRAKRLGRELRIPSGTVTLKDYDVTLGCPAGSDLARGAGGCRTVSARVDDSGELRLDGTFRFAGFKLSRLDVHIGGDNLDWGSAGIYSLTLSPDVELTGSSERLRLGGRVTLVSGTYSQPFDYKELIIKPRAVETEPPFYQGVPVLEHLGLDLSVTSSGPLQAKNNIANMQVSVPALYVSGTLSQPILKGEVVVEEGGTFKIPLLRADFVTDRGSVTFERERSFPDDTGLNINAWSDWFDRYEQLHHIVLRLSGTLAKPELILSSTDGWDKNQVLSALLTGSAPDDLRKSFQSDPTAARGGNAAEGLWKTGSGELFGNLVEDPLKSIFKLELVRVELGYVKFCPYNRRYIRLCGTGEGQIAPTSNYNARVELKLSDDLSMVGSAEHLEHGIDTSEEIVNRGRIQLRFKFPIY